MSSDKSIYNLLPLHYQGHQIRTAIDDQGHVWWVAQDVGHVLGITQVRKNLQTFPMNEKGVTSSNTLGGLQDLLTVNEPGLYRLIFQSRKPEAEALKLWVFHEVLPTLRRTGTYILPTATDHRIPEADQLTPKGQLPPPPSRVREHAEVSWHLLAVWCLLRDTGEWLSNHEIAQRTGMVSRTVRAHTYYLKHLGLIDVQEAFPRHLHCLSPVAAQRNAGVYARLNLMASVLQERQEIRDL
jgi:prophage antirepressor-like protein